MKAEIFFIKNQWPQIRIKLIPEISNDATLLKMLSVPQGKGHVPVIPYAHTLDSPTSSPDPLCANAFVFSEGEKP